MNPYMLPDKDILEQLDYRIKDHPEFMQDAINTSLSSLKSFLQTQEHKRDILCWNALNSMAAHIEFTIGFDKAINKETIPWWVDAIVYLCPAGYNSNLSNVTDKMLNIFCKEYFDPQNKLYKSDWERETKGYGEYMDILYEQYNTQ